MARVASSAHDGLTVDAWYTLFRPTARGRRRLESERQRAWTGSLEGAGVAGPDAVRRFREVVAEGRRREAHGRAFRLAEQAAWLGRRVRRPLDAEAIETALGRSLDRVEVALAPHALRELRTLRRRGVRIAVVSNVLFEGGPAMRRLLRRTGVAALADTIVLSTELGAAKPSARPIRTALRSLGVRADHTVHIGDETADLRSAWAARVGAVRYTGFEAAWPPDHLPADDPDGAAAPILPSFRGFADGYAPLRAAAHAARQASA